MQDEEFYELRRQYDDAALSVLPFMRAEICRKFLEEHPEYAAECQRRGLEE